MANEIGIAVCVPQFEVPVVGSEPRVKHLDDIDAMASKNQRPWRLLAAVTRVALDTNVEERFIHLNAYQIFRIRLGHQVDMTCDQIDGSESTNRLMTLISLPATSASTVI